jgi:hypothetical protein
MPLRIFAIFDSVIGAVRAVLVTSGGRAPARARPLRTNHESIRGVCQKMLWLESKNDSGSIR